ncbi:MAG: hypothetical protein AB8B91_04430 [Rubripirellula sp.]
MDRFAYYLSVLGLLATIGCGSDSQTAQNQPAGGSSAAAATQTAPTGPSPTDIVSQFLDEIRRGGEGSSANNLLTVRAQQELNRIGQSIQPIGSPDARFTVTRAELVPNEEDSALVHSVWSEPSAEGATTDFQVVWAVEKEPAGWRISGLAMELEPGSNPIIIDFENAEMMANLLAPSESNPSETKAATPETAVVR